MTTEDQRFLRELYDQNFRGSRPSVEASRQRERLRTAGLIVSRKRNAGHAHGWLVTAEGARLIGRRAL